MTDDNNSFRHDSLQDAESIQEFLKAISKGFGKGKLTFSEDEREITLTPDGLLDLKVTASKEDNRHRVNIRVSWDVDQDARKKRNLKVS
ncbi:MAG: amphi-Trp domain-containing protein [Gammaproteobacteria bacterium]